MLEEKNMNEWITNNFAIFVVILLVFVIALIVLSVIALRNLRILVKNTVDSSLRMEANLEFDSIFMKDELIISVYNTNFRDIIIHSFGFVYKDQIMDFVREYMKENDMKDFPVVPARSSIDYKLDPFRVEKFILDNNFEKKTVYKIFNVVIDSVGFDTKSKNKALRKVFRKRHKARLKKAKVILHNRKIAQYQKTHDDKLPISNIFWKWFHSDEVKVPELMELASSIKHDDDIRVAEKKKMKVEKADKPIVDSAAKSNDKETAKKQETGTATKPKIETFDKKKIEEVKKELEEVEKIDSKTK